MKSPIVPARVLPVIARAVAILGDEHTAATWLSTPLEALRDRAPAELLSTEEGIELVQLTLTRIELKIPL